MTNITPAEEFRDSEGLYRFPFKVLDDTPGGSSLGRIEWNVEFMRSRKRQGRYHISKMLVWASQTRDRQYAGKCFEIPCNSDAIHGRRYSKPGAFTQQVWLVGFCPEHGSPMMSAYPDDNHSVLIINVGSSISVDVYFK